MIQLPGYQPTAATRPLQGISGEAAAAPSRALQSVAQGISTIGSVAGNIAENLMRVDNARELSEARQTLAQNYAQFQIDLQTEVDPQARLDKTGQFLESQRSLLYNPDHAPVVRQALDAHLSDFSSRASITAAQDAAQLTNRRATLAFQNEVAIATRNGDRDAYNTAKATASDALGLLPEELDAMDADFDRNIEYQSTILQIQDYPTAALESLESDSFLETNPNLQQQDRDRLTRYAKQVIQDKRGEEIELMEEAVATNRLSPVDIEAAEHLTPKDRRAFLDAIQKQEAESPISRQEYLNAWKVADALRAARTDPAVSDDAYRLIHNEARTDILARVPPSLQGDLKKELGYLSPAGRDTSQPVTSSDRSELEAIGRAQISRAHDAGMYGDTSKEADYESKEKAARKSEDLRLQVKRFIGSKNPPPTPEEVRAYVDTLNGTAIGGDTPLIPAIPPAFSIGSEIDALLQIAPLPPGRENIPPGPIGSTDLLLPPKP